MKQILVKKEEGILLKPTVIDKTTKKFYHYITVEENCFANVLDLKTISQFNSDTIDPITKTIEQIIKNYFLPERFGEEFIEKLFKMIIFAESKKDLLQIVNIFIKQLKKLLDKQNGKTSNKIELGKSLIIKLQQSLEKNLDLTLAIFVKKIFYIYYRTKIINLSISKKMELEKLKNDGVAPDAMLTFLQEKFYEPQSENGTDRLAASVLEQVVDNIFSEEKTHLCWQDCANARANLCPKIADREVKHIDEYDIITDGYQTFDTKGELLSFYVTGCKLYRRQYKKELTPEQKRHMSELKASLKTHYYGTDTLEEAEQAEQRDMAQRLKFQRQNGPGRKRRIN